MQQSAAASPEIPDSGRGGTLATWLVPAGLVYFTLIGGTGPGELQPILRLVNSAIGIALIVLWLRAAPHHADALDRSVLGALLLYLVSAVLARAPHAAFEAAVTTTAYVALLFVLRTAMSNPEARRRTAQWLGLTGVVVAVAYATIWLVLWSQWLGVGQPGSALFYLPVPGGPYGFKHNVALVAGLLIPFLWVAPLGTPGRVQRVIGVAVLVPVLIMAGSRGLWLGALLASAGVLLMRATRGRRRRNVVSRRWLVVVVVAGLVMAVVALLVPDLAQAVGSRIGGALSVSARLDLWQASLAEWRSSVLTGVGPGGWPIWLPTTGYFDITAFSPRHPDSLLFQLLAETGIAGVAAVLLLGRGVLRTLRAVPPGPVVWVALFVLVACLTANPTDLPFAIVLGIVWLAIAVPREPPSGVAAPIVAAPRRTLATARWALLALIAVVVGMSAGAGISHDLARQAVTAGDLGAAERRLEVAIALDPGLALYRREHAALLLATGDRDGALAALQEARILDPADDIAAAELAVVWSLGGKDGEAMGAAVRAVELRRSAPINHLVLAWVAGRAGQPAISASALEGSLVLAPWLTANPDWQALRGANGRAEILSAAAVAAATDRNSLSTGAAAWLAGLSGREDLLESDIRGAASDHLSLHAFVALLGCDVPGAARILDQAATSDAASATYWAFRAMLDRARGDTGAQSVQIAALLGPTLILTSDVPGSSSAFAARADDQWVYRRIPILLGAVGPAFPSDEAGLSRWMTDPRGAAGIAAPGSALATCHG